MRTRKFYTFKGLWLTGTLLLATLIPTWCSAAHITIVTPTVTTGPSGIYTYSYAVTNVGSDNIFDFFLLSLRGVIAESLMAPPGWDFILDPGIVTIDWVSLDPTSDIVSGATLAGFSYKSSASPGQIQFLTIAADPITGFATDVKVGQTVGPVPEPSSLSLLALGLGMVFLFRMGQQNTLSEWEGGKRSVMLFLICRIVKLVPSQNPR